jgi:hypothetical protein
MMDVVMHKFDYGNADIPGVYYDEVNRQQLEIIRRANTDLAIDLAGKNRKEDARNVLDKADKMMLQQNFPYGLVSRSNEHDRVSLMFLEACYRADDKPLVDKVSASVKKDLKQQIIYYNSLPEDKAAVLQYEKSAAQSMLDDMDRLEKAFAPKSPQLQ